MDIIRSGSKGSRDSTRKKPPSAREAGVSTETINAIEHGRRDFIWPKTARKLAGALGVEPDDLYR
jgi:DNA-binding XRE family transcriptional regulator